jgi:hypothetical protein
MMHGPEKVTDAIVDARVCGEMPIAMLAAIRACFLRRAVHMCRFGAQAHVLPETWNLSSYSCISTSFVSVCHIMSSSECRDSEHEWCRAES